MQLGRLVRALAWEVSPGQTTDFAGGTVNATPVLLKGLNEAATKGKIDTGLPVVFETARTNLVRADLMTVAYGEGPDALTASRRVAEYLGTAMDGRSKACLLVMSCHAPTGGTGRRLLVSTFPGDSVMRRSASAVDILDDVFSLTSKLRKAALLEGANDKSGFLKLRVVDYETTSTDRSVADFWVERFLRSRTEINSREGTAILGKALRKANELLADEPQAKEQLHAAIAALRSGPAQRRSINSVASELLDGKARAALLTAAGDGPQNAAVFTLDQEQFAGIMQYRVLTLDNDVTLSAPFLNVGAGPDYAVQIEEVNGRQKATASGFIESDGLRRRG